MSLNRDQFKQLHMALLNAFPNIGSLQLMVKIGLGANPNAIMANTNLSEAIFQLIEWTEAQNKVMELVRHARLSNPGNQALQHVERELLGVTLSSNFRSSAVIIKNPTETQIAEQFRNRVGLVAVRGLSSPELRNRIVPIYRNVMPAGTLELYTDLEMFTDEQMSTADTYFKAVAEDVAASLKFDFNINEHWKARLGPQRNMINFIHDYVLKAVEGLVVWRIYHVDRLVNTQYANDAFSLYRVLYNQAWDNLIIVLCCQGDPNTFIQNTHMSPFNVGVRLEFTA